MLNLFRNFFKDIKNNYKTLILAFVIAVIFWLVVSIQMFPTGESTIKDIHIEAQPTEYMTQNNLQIISAIKDTANIKIEGKRYDISGLSADDFTAGVNLSSIRSAGTYTLPITITAKTDKSYTLLESVPSTITLEVDEIVTKEFTVEGTAPDVSLPDGYYADEITANPETISVTGSRSIVDNITRIEARSTFHGEISESHQTGADIFIYGENGAKIVDDSLKLSTDTVTVNVQILKQKELPLKISITNYPSNFDIDSLQYDIQPSTITVAAPDESIDNLSELVVGTIDLSDINLSRSSYVPIVLPDGYKNLSGNNNARIEWKTANYGMLDFAVRGTNIVVTNVPDNYDISLITSQLALTIIGPSVTLTDISEADISVTINLLGVTLREGSQDVPVTVAVKGTKQKCWAAGDYKATIRVTPKQIEQQGNTE